jgi:chemotaxis protein methyltransferase CheR
MDAALRENIVFAVHNLATDDVFGEMHAVICRNVLIYFNRELQERVVGLFTKSLCRRGFLCLGTKETLQFSRHAAEYECVDAKQRIYRRTT